MAWYFWRGKYQNSICSGISKAYNENYLRQHLLSYDVDLLEHKLASKKIRLTLNQRFYFYRSLLALLKSGLPLRESLEILLKQAKRKNFNVFLHALITDLEFGLQELSVDDVFPPHEAIFIKIGLENNLINFLSQLVQTIQVNLQFKKKIFKILLMPLLSFISLVVVFIFMVFYVIPEIADFTGAQPDFLFCFNNLCVFEWIMIIITVSSLIYILIRNFFLIAKILFFPELQILPGLKVFSCLLQAGLTSSQAFFTLSSLKTFADWDKLFDLQKKGLNFFQAMQAANWHKIAPELLSVVELSSIDGNLAKNMQLIVDYYNQKTIDKLELIVTIIQPLILLFIASIVFLLISKVYMPIIDINNFVI